MIDEVENDVWGEGYKIFNQKVCCKESWDTGKNERGSYKNPIPKTLEGKLHRTQ